MKIFAISAFLLTVRLFAADTAPQIGQAAPDFTLPSQDGSTIRLHDFKGKWVVLYFYPKDGTQGCTIKAHNFQRDLPKYEHKRAVIVGVSVDSTGSHQEFCAKQGLTFKLLADTEPKVSRLYGSLTNLLVYQMSSRNTFLISPDGKSRPESLTSTPNSASDHSGPEGSIPSNSQSRTPPRWVNPVMFSWCRCPWPTYKQAPKVA